MEEILAYCVELLDPVVVALIVIVLFIFVESTPRTAMDPHPSTSTLKTSNWSAQGEIASDFDNNWSRLRRVSRRF
jgi:hypothetical protein